MHIAMIAAENGALRGGKVGGIGDVIRDVPVALAEEGHHVSVLTPGYMALSKHNPASLIDTVNVRFCGQTETLEIYRVEGSIAAGPVGHKHGKADVTHYVLEHPLFAACGVGSIYCDDHYGPFATDAHKFSLFCTAVCQLLVDKKLADVDVLHLHDWHAAMLSILRRHVPAYRKLQQIPVVFSIHNLSLQGVRPLSGDGSSLHNWFPELIPDLNSIQDPAHWDCLNLMRAGINLSERVHAVSPSYAKEILIPTDHSRGFIGGEGLQSDLQRVADDNRLVGILNGCDYSIAAVPTSTKSQLYDLMETSISHWVGDRQYIPSAHFHGQCRIAKWRKRRKAVDVILTSVGRLTGQKSRLFMEDVADGKGGVISALDRLLDNLTNGIFIMLGSGDEMYEGFFTDVMIRRDNFLFLRGFSEQLAAALYSSGDVFIMPSSYEPCGISQMLAMRAGTPCVVHHVGGLRDTVEHGVNGFSFSGDTTQGQAQNMITTVQQACDTMANPAQWQKICTAALNTRFTWKEVVIRYINELYPKESNHEV